MPQSSLVAAISPGGTTRPVAEHRGWKGSSLCHGVMGYCASQIEIPRIYRSFRSRYVMISMFFLVSFTCFRLWSIKDTAVPCSRSILQERPDLAEEKARLVEGAPGRGFSSHGGSPVVTMVEWLGSFFGTKLETSSLNHFHTYDMTENVLMSFRFSVPYPSKLLRKSPKSYWDNYNGYITPFF